VKVKARWRQETEGVTEFEVDANEVLAWLSDPVTGGPDAGTWTLDKITPKECLEWLQSGDDDVWRDQIDYKRDAVTLPWSDTELDGLEP
jgi:hypothetical protein